MWKPSDSSNTLYSSRQLVRGMGPIFYAALAHTDNLAYFTDEEGCKRERVSTLNLLPRVISENLLFSMSFDSDIHYDSQNHLLDPNGVNERLLESRASPRRLLLIVVPSNTWTWKLQ